MRLLKSTALLAVLLVGSAALAQQDVPPTSTAAPSQQTPAYEVATIKTPGPNDYAMPLRQYLQVAFGLPGNATGLVFGPDWINSATYAIHGKVPDSIHDAMKAMSLVERGKEERLMMQALLADRFKLKTHFEMREMPLYELIVARGGPKLVENPDSSQGEYAVGASRIRGKSVPIKNLIDALESVPDIGGRVVVDKTGLSGRYDVAFKWTPLDAKPSPDADGAPLFTAIQEQLGLKLVPSKEPGQVLVIDHIERPSEN